MLSRITQSAKLVPKYFTYLTAFKSFVTTQKFTEKYKAVEFSIFDGENIGLVKNVLNSASKQEPVCYHLSSRNFNFFLEPYLMKAIADELSLSVTVNDGVFAGIALNNDFTVKEDKHFMDALRKRDFYGFDLMWKIELDLNYDFRVEMHEKDLFCAGNILRMLLFGVDPFFANQGLGTQLVEKTVELAKEKGFKYITCAATTQPMKRCCEKAGFKVQNVIKYSEWEYLGVHPKAGMKELTGYDEIYFMVNRLPKKDKKIKAGPEFRPIRVK